MWRKILILCACVALSLNTALAQPPATPGDSGHRGVALVIGNGDYRHHPLPNARRDAQAMAARLSTLGFDVMHHENLGAGQFGDAVREFAQRLDDGGTGLFYFSGHGIQVGGATLLLPVDADGQAPATMLTRGVDLRTVLQGMSAPRPDLLNLVILDQCLNNPFGSGSVPYTGVPPDTLLAFATAVGGYAGDTAEHGLFTEELLKALRAPGMPVRALFRQVDAAVRTASAGRQRPSIVSTLSGARRLVPASVRAPSALPPAAAPRLLLAQSRGILPKDSAEQYELTFWESIKDSTHASDYEAYLQAYPNGRFAALAKARIARLRADEKAKATAEQKPPATPKPPAKAPAERAAPAPAAKEPPKEPPKALPKETPAKARAEPASPPESKAASATAAEVKDCPACPTLISVPAGSFNMGSNTTDPSERPAHRVKIAHPYAIGKYEVTVEEWQACAEAGGCPRIDANGKRPKSPMRDVSWDDAQKYVKWLSKQTGKSYRLPTEAEWEYAARGGTATTYWWGDQMRKGNANCKDCGDPWQEDAPADVGSFTANPFGLHDVNGSVWEWVSDCWHTSYKGAPADASSWDAPGCRVRVIRGGSWREGASYMPASTRFKYDASVRQSQNGFRVAREMK